MDAEYARAYAGLYRRHWWWRARERVVLATLRELVPDGKPRRILDVGCGSGVFLGALAEFGEAEGVEPVAELAAASPHRSRIHVTEFDGRFRAERPYDLVLMLDVLEHLPDPVVALQAARDALAPGGKLVVTVPAFRWLWTSHDDLNHHRTRYTRSELAKEARAAGFELLSARYFFHWMVPAKLLVRAAERVGRATAAPPVVPRAAINQLLYRLSVLEEGMFRRLRVPFGTSLLAVARAI